MRVVDASGNRINSTAVVNLHLQVRGTMLKQRFLVVPNLSVPCVLGCDFIDCEIDNISPRNRYIILNDGDRVHIGRRRPRHTPESAYRPKKVVSKFYHSIRVAKRTVLESGHTTIVPVTTAAAGLRILTPRPSLMADMGVQMANEVVNIRPNVPFYVEVTNFSKKNKTVPKRMIIGSVGGAPHMTLCIDVHSNGNVNSKTILTPARSIVRHRRLYTSPRP